MVTNTRINRTFNIIFAANLDKVADRNTSRFITDVLDSEPMDMH